MMIDTVMALPLLHCLATCVASWMCTYMYMYILKRATQYRTFLVLGEENNQVCINISALFLSPGTTQGHMMSSGLPPMSCMCVHSHQAAIVSLTICRAAYKGQHLAPLSVLQPQTFVVVEC